MIVWSGFGFLTVLILGVGLAVGAFLGSSAGLAEGYALGLGLLIGAIGNWFAGKAMNDPARGREMIDAKTGQRIVFRPNHSLFWVPMQWWSVVAVIAAVAFLVMQATGNFGPSRAKRADAPSIVTLPG